MKTDFISLTTIVISLAMASSLYSEDAKVAADPATKKKPEASQPIAAAEPLSLGSDTLHCMIDEETSVDGTAYSSATEIWKSGEQYRQEITPKGATKTIQIEANGSTYSYVDGTKEGMILGAGMVRGMLGLFETVNVVKATGDKKATEKIDGRDCDLFEMSLEGQKLSAWISQSDGLPVKMIIAVNVGNTNTVSTRIFRKIEKEIGDADMLFKIPDGVEFKPVLLPEAPSVVAPVKAAPAPAAAAAEPAAK